MEGVSAQTTQAQAWFDRWLGEHNEDQWSFTRLTDAQKESLLWIGLSFIFAATMCNYGQIHQLKVDEHGEICSPPEIETVWIYEWYGRLNPLAPIKYLTVLYHEICHALVGFLSGGRPILIIVDWNEGGATFFAPRSQHPGQPSYGLTLPAGYVGSCTIGSAMVFAGFDTVASKYAALGYALMAVPALVICMMILSKNSIRHNRDKRRMRRATEEKERAQKGQDATASRGEDKRLELASEQELMASAWLWVERLRRESKGALLTSRIVLTTGLIAVSWYLYDSLYLRFVILFLGTINALYAIWDIFLDGIKYGSTCCSDCTLMAEKFNKKRVNKISIKKFASCWILFQVVIFVGAIVLGLYVWQDTISEQALRSRHSLWATSSHYTPLNLAQSAKEGAQGWFE